MKWLLTLVALAAAMPAQGQIVIAHRGASGDRPEHTLAAYERAIDQGADYIEPDLVATKDGVLVARHENEISGTTDVSQRPEFAARRATRVIDGETVSGWFTEDFSWAELQTLRARERLPGLRPASSRFDDLYRVPSLAEIIALVRAKEAETGRQIGLYPEIKHPSYFRAIGLELEQRLVDALHAAGYRHADDPVFIQSFEVEPLVRLAGMTALPLIQLVYAEGGPADKPDLSYAEMLQPAGLDAITAYAEGIGANIGLLLRADGTPTELGAIARQRGLLVHAWTLRKENGFLPPAAHIGDDPAMPGCGAWLWRKLAAVPVDGVFTDDPGLAIGWRDGGSDPACAASRPRQDQP
ncbi:MAG: glycerophosphodiester phosphodiesterase [Sphingomonadales bacterium]